jgi:hypothetical protein
MVIKGTTVVDGPWHSTWYPVVLHSHPSGHSAATLAGTITNRNQYTTAGVANSRDSNTTVSFDGLASCCNLERERETEVMIIQVTVFAVWVRWREI